MPSVTVAPVAITPDDGFALYTSLAGGTVSIWMVPIAGGQATKLTDGSSAAVSPDGGSLSYIATAADGRFSLLVCSLPACTSPRAVGSVTQSETATAWTPDGRGVAYASEGNVWVQPLSGGAPRQLTRFTQNLHIGSFAWSRDGKRLALTRSTVTHDIVLFRGLK